MDGWRFAPSALQELLAYAAYLDEQTGSVRPADHFIEVVLAVCDRLAVFPRMGSQRDYAGRAYRAFPAGGHMILYRIRADEIEITHVIHQRLL